MPVVTVQDLILAISKLDGSATVLNHLKSIKYTLAPRGDIRTGGYVATKGQSKKNYFTNSLPQVHITDNSVPAIQQAIDELVRNIGRVSKK